MKLRYRNVCFCLTTVLLLNGCLEYKPDEGPDLDTAVEEEAEVIPQSAASAPGKVDEDAPEEFTETKSGLKYRIRRKSDGKKPKRSDYVFVHYRGWLDDETVFDSSYTRGEATEFPLGGVIPGWTEGLQLIGEGGMIELDIPAELGYGAREQPGIPANSRLHFIVELLKIK